MFNPESVMFTPEELELARELDEMLEALALGVGDKFKESMEAGMELLKIVPGASDRKKLLLKVLVVLLLDNLQEHVPGFVDEEDY